MVNYHISRDGSKKVCRAKSSATCRMSQYGDFIKDESSNGKHSEEIKKDIKFALTDTNKNISEDEQKEIETFSQKIDNLLHQEFILPPSFKKHDGSAGDFLEFLMGKPIDNLSSPDFGKIELKTKMQTSSSLISLITKSPINANLLRTKYGKTEKNEEGFEYKRLNATIRYSEFIQTENPYSFRLDLDKSEQKLLIIAKNMLSGEVIRDTGIYYNTSDLQKVVDNKLKIVALATFSKRIENKNWFYTYNDYNIVHFDTKNLFDLIKNDIIKLDIRMGCYKSGKNKGRLHDHGTGLRISLKSFLSV